MKKKDTNLNLTDKKKRTNKNSRLHPRKNKGTSKKIKRKKNKTLKKGGASMTPGMHWTPGTYVTPGTPWMPGMLWTPETYMTPGMHGMHVPPGLLRRQISGASQRDLSVQISTVVETWWNNSQNLIPNLFQAQQGIQILRIPLSPHEKKKIFSGTTVYGETIYLITITNGTKDIKHLLKISVGFNNGDVYTTIFLYAINETELLHSQDYLKHCKWYELFHISDHPGASENPSGAIHLKTISNINEIIMNLRTFSNTPYVSFYYGDCILVSLYQDEKNDLTISNYINDIDKSLEHIIIRSDYPTRTIKIDLNPYTHKLYLTSSFYLIGSVVDQYLYSEMSLFPVLHGLGWTEYPTPP